MPTDKLIDQRIREKREVAMSKEASEEIDRSTHKMSISSHIRKDKPKPQIHGDFGGVKMRKDDLKVYHSFLDMLKQYDFEDGMAIIESLTAQFRAECEEEVGEEEIVPEEGEEEEIMENSED